MYKLTNRQHFCMVYTLINSKMFKTQVKGSDFTAKRPASAQKQKNKLHHYHIISMVCSLIDHSF